MKSIRIFTIVFLLTINFLISCSGSSIHNDTIPVLDDQTILETEFDDTTVGTIITNPKPPANSIFPDFTEELPALYTDSNESKSAMADFSLFGPEVAKMLGEIYHQRKVKEFNIKILLNSLNKLGEGLDNELEAASIAMPVQEDVTYQLVEPLKLFTYSTSQWILNMSQDKTSSDFTRIYFINPDQGANTIQASYVFKIDENGLPVKGMFGYVFPVLLDTTNPETVSLLNPEKDKIVLFILTYDFTDKSQNIINIRADRYQHNFGNTTVQAFLQCDKDNVSCTMEQQQIVSEAPVRKMARTIVRYAWTDTLNQVCFNQMDYAMEYPFIKNNYFYDATTNIVSQNNCTVNTPLWGQHRFITDDFLFRYADTDPFGGTILKIYAEDSLETAGWDTYINPSLIDNTLNASQILN